MNLACGLECKYSPIDTKHFPLPVNVKWLGGRNFELLSPFEYHRPNKEVIRAETGFVTDGASIPPIFYSWVGPPIGPYFPAAIIHDFLCQSKPYKYAKIDYIFYEALQFCDMPKWRRWLFYFGVSVWHIAG